MQFVTPPSWPPAPQGWTPPLGWEPDPSWPAAPAGWQFWQEGDPDGPVALDPDAAPGSTAAVGYPASGVPSAPTGPVDNSLAWALALTPVAFFVLDVLLLLMGVSPFDGPLRWAPFYATVA